MPRKKTLEEFLDDLAVRRPDLEYVEGYAKYSADAEVRSRECGHSWKATPKNLLQNHSGCPECAQRSRNEKHTYAQEEFEQLVASKLGSVRIVGEYRGMREKVEYECKRCGKRWSASARSLVDGRSATHEEGCGSAHFPSMTDDAVRGDFAAGMTRGEIAEKYGCTKRTVSYRLEKLGLRYRKQRK